MKSLEDLTRTEGYWITTIQADLAAKADAFKQARKWSRTQLASYLLLSENQTNKLLNGDFDGKLSTLIRLALALKTVPNLCLQKPEIYMADLLGLAR